MFLYVSLLVNMPPCRWLQTLFLLRVMDNHPGKQAGRRREEGGAGIRTIATKAVEGANVSERPEVKMRCGVPAGEAPSALNPARPSGRTVVKNDYQAEYDKVQAKAKTREYEETRRVHPRIERKLNELARHHRCRRACYRGQPKVLVQTLLTALVVNVKRMVKLLARSLPSAIPTLTVRAEEAGT